MDTSTAVVERDKVGRRRAQRRVYTLEEKVRVVAEANECGASVADVARRHGINANLLFNWRRQHQRGILEEHTRQIKLLPVQVTAAVAPPHEDRRGISTREDDGRIEILLAKDVRVTIIGPVAAECIERVLSVLRCCP
jgi:transposase